MIDPNITPETLEEMSKFFKVFGDSTRIKIMYILAQKETNVCDISKALFMTQSSISHQLSYLRQVNLVKARKEGKTVFYSLADDHIVTIFKNGLEHVTEKE